MDWINGLFTVHSAIQTVVVLSLICYVGLILGKIHVKGISLGVAFVFFIGIIAGHWGLDIDPTVLQYAEAFGLVLFVYTLGLHVGPNFFGSLRKEGISLNLWGFAVIAVGTILALVLSEVTNVPMQTMVGILSGAVTNTPALGAAQQALENFGFSTRSAALGCAVAYPLGVLGVIFAMIFLRKFFVRPDDLVPRLPQDEDHTYVAQYEMVNQAIDGKTLAEISQMAHIRFIVSRISRNEQVIVLVSTTKLRLGDNVLVVTTDDEVGGMELLLGKKVDKDWNKDKIDWNHIDKTVESKVVVITRPMLNGKKLGSLQLRNTYGVNVSRVTRGDTKLLGTNDLRLQYGDRVTVVGEHDALENVEHYLGNAVQTLNEPITIGNNYASKRVGKKGIIKVTDRYFTDEEISRLSVVAPNVVLNIIKDYEVIEKKKVETPAELKGIVRCNNPKCITNNEPMQTVFNVVDKISRTLKCHYCDMEQAIDKVQLV